MTKNQTIKCNVESCAFNDCKCNECTLNEIKVTNDSRCSEHEAHKKGDTICQSFKNTNSKE